MAVEEAEGQFGFVGLQLTLLFALGLAEAGSPAQMFVPFTVGSSLGIFTERSLASFFAFPLFVLKEEALKVAFNTSENTKNIL